MANDRDHDTMMSDFYATVQNQAERIAQQLAEQPQQLAEQPTPPWAPVPLQRPRTLPQGAGPPIISPAALTRAAARRRGESGPSTRSDPAALIRIARGNGRLPRAPIAPGGMTDSDPATMDSADNDNDNEEAEPSPPSLPAAPRTIPEVTEAQQRSLVMSYLLHHCYGKTAEALAECTGGGKPCSGSGGGSGSQGEAPGTSKATAPVDTRLPIIQAVLRGDVLGAMRMAEDLKHDIFAARPDVQFDLRCLEFVNLVRSGDTLGAVAYAQAQLRPFGFGEGPRVEQLEECLALLAYEDPAASPVGQYLSDDFKQQVADALNGALLEAADLPSRAPLEVVLQHLTVLEGMPGGGSESPRPRFRLEEWINCSDD